MAETTPEIQIVPVIRYRNADGGTTLWETPTTVYRYYDFGALEDPATGQKYTPMKDTEKYEVRFYEGSDPEPWRKKIASPSPGFDVVTIGRPQGTPTLFCYQLAS